MTTGAGLDGCVAAAAAGDRDAFARLVDESAGMVSAIALAILRDADQSRDVVQEVFLAAWTGLRRLRNPASFLPWLRETTRHRAYDALRSRGRARRTFTGAGDEEALASAADPRPDAARALLADEERRLLQEALDALPDETREVLVLYYREERSTRQVAALLEIGEEAVRQRLARARSALRADVLERLGRAVQRTPSGSAVTAAVMLALPAAAPGAVTAGTLAAASEAAPRGLPTPQLVGAALGAAMAVGAVLVGVRRHRSIVMDARERRAMRRMTATTGVLSAATCAAMIVLGQPDRPWRSVAMFGAFVLALGLQRFVWLPRIQGPRLEAERLADPSAAARQAREWRIGSVCWLLGVLGGCAGLVAGLLSR